MDNEKLFDLADILKTEGADALFSKIGNEIGLSPGDNPTEEEFSESLVGGNEREKTSLPREEPSPDSMPEIGEYLRSLSESVSSIGNDLGKVSAKIETVNKETHEIHRKVHSEFAERTRSMQEELDRYREIDRNRAFDTILTEIAMLYSNNCEVLADTNFIAANPQMAKRLANLFADIEQVLESNGAQKQESNYGDKRSARFCQVLERLQTDDQTQHDTVAKSRRVGFFIENRPLVKELVDVFVYSKCSTEKVAEESPHATQPERASEQRQTEN